MTLRHAFAILVALAFSGCGGGDGGGGGPDPINLTNFQVAADIIAQSSANGSTPNNGAGPGLPNPSGTHAPAGHVGNGSLYLADVLNNRVLGFNSMPTGFGANADFVLGAPNFTTVGGGTSATLLTSPQSCWVSGNALFVVDGSNQRVLIYSPPPVTTNAPAGVALGKPDLTTSGYSNGPSGLGNTADVCVAAGRVVVADLTNRRVMIWNGIPVASGASAQLVIGQPDFATISAGTTAAKVNAPTGVWTDGTRLVVADAGNHRVLIWNTFPTVSGQAADVVIGQPDFVTSTPGAGALKLNSPWSVASDGAQLFVADLSNHRVLVYSPFPTTNNAAAVRVLGQSNFTNVAPNDDDQNGVSDPAPSARTFRTPVGVTAIGNRLLVTDQSNQRVLIFTGS